MKWGKGAVLGEGGGSADYYVGPGGVEAAGGGVVAAKALARSLLMWPL